MRLTSSKKVDFINSLLFLLALINVFSTVDDFGGFDLDIATLFLRILALCSVQSVCFVCWPCRLCPPASLNGTCCPLN